MAEHWIRVPIDIEVRQAAKVRAAEECLTMQQWFQLAIIEKLERGANEN